MRNIVAIIIAPLVPTILLIGLPVLLTQSWPFNYSNYKIVVFSSVIPGYVGMVAIGLPSVLLLRRMQRLNMPNIIFIGAISGILVFIIFSLILGLLLNTVSSLNVLNTAIYGSFFGISVSLTYGVISGITRRSSGVAKKDAPPLN